MVEIQNVKHTLKKSERLCSKKIIDALFDRNNAANSGFLVYPIRVVVRNTNYELRITNKEIRSTNEEAGTGNEELGITNYDLRSTNKEIRSTNEEAGIRNEELGITNYELRIRNKESEIQNPKVLFSVPKRAFKKAVDRNSIKRRIREAYRLNKKGFENDISIAFIYVAKEICEYKVIEKSMKRILDKIGK